MTKVQQCTWNVGMFGIANAEGKPWTPRTFDSRAQAQEFLDKKNKHPLDLSSHTVVPVSVTVRCIGTGK